MHRHIIGAVFAICGTLLFSSILISGAIYSSTMDGWIGSSKFWHAILGKSSADDSLYSMGLAFLFYFSIALFLFGIICLFWARLKSWRK